MSDGVAAESTSRARSSEAVEQRQSDPVGPKGRAAQSAIIESAHFMGVLRLGAQIPDFDEVRWANREALRSRFFPAERPTVASGGGGTRHGCASPSHTSLSVPPSHLAYPCPPPECCGCDFPCLLERVDSATHHLRKAGRKNRVTASYRASSFLSWELFSLLRLIKENDDDKILSKK